MDVEKNMEYLKVECHIPKDKVDKAYEDMQAIIKKYAGRETGHRQGPAWRG